MYYNTLLLKCKGGNRMNYKAGLFYFPLSCDFFTQKEILYIKARFGAKGLYIVQRILCEIYSKNGYWTKLTTDDCVLMQEEWGCQISASLIQEVIAESVKRGFFSKSVFDKFGVLTSEGIQRDYIRCKSKSDVIYIKEEYWLLNIENKKDVPASILKKIVFNTNDSGKKSNDSGKKSNDSGKIKQRKEKENEIKSNEIKEDKSKMLSLFEKIWEIYPKQINRIDALTVFEELNATEELVDEMIKAINKQKKQESWNVDEGKYIPYLSTWIKKEKWKDKVNIQQYYYNPNPKNSFTNFKQRVYTDEEFEAILERKRKEGKAII